MRAAWRAPTSGGCGASGNSRPVICWTKVNTVGPVFDLDKLNWLNGHYIRSLSADDFAERIVEHLRFTGTEMSATQVLAEIGAYRRFLQGRLCRVASVGQVGFFSRNGRGAGRAR